MAGTWHYVTRSLPGIGVVLTVYDAYGNEINEVVEDTADKAFEKAKEKAKKDPRERPRSIYDYD